MNHAVRVLGAVAGAGLLLAAAAAAVAQPPKPATPGAMGVNVAAAGGVEIAALRNELNALKAENAAMKADIALLKTQVGNAVQVNVNQGQQLNPLPARLDALEHRMNRHTHRLRINDEQNGKKYIAVATTSEPSEFCTQSGNTYNCVIPPKP